MDVVDCLKTGAFQTNSTHNLSYYLACFSEFYGKDSKIVILRSIPVELLTFHGIHLSFDCIALADSLILDDDEEFVFCMVKESRYIVIDRYLTVTYEDKIPPAHYEEDDIDDYWKCYIDVQNQTWKFNLLSGGLPDRMEVNILLKPVKKLTQLPKYFEEQEQLGCHRFRMAAEYNYGGEFNYGCLAFAFGVYYGYSEPRIVQLPHGIAGNDVVHYGSFDPTEENFDLLRGTASKIILYDPKVKMIAIKHDMSWCTVEDREIFLLRLKNCLALVNLENNNIELLGDLPFGSLVRYVKPGTRDITPPHMEIDPEVRRQFLELTPYDASEKKTSNAYVVDCSKISRIDLMRKIEPLYNKRCFCAFVKNTTRITRLFLDDVYRYLFNSRLEIQVDPINKETIGFNTRFYEYLLTNTIMVVYRIDGPGSQILVSRSGKLSAFRVARHEANFKSWVKMIDRSYDYVFAMGLVKNKVSFLDTFMDLEGDLECVLYVSGLDEVRSAYDNTEEFVRSLM